jgi:hypothetical protein
VCPMSPVARARIRSRSPAATTMATTMVLVTDQAARKMEAIPADERRFCLGEDGHSELSADGPQPPSAFWTG